MDMKQVILPLYETRGWMRFLGVVMIIVGILTALTIVGILIAWLPIWLGALLFQAAGRVESAYAAEDELLLTASLSKLKTFFVIQGVLLLIYLGVAIVFLMMGGLASLAILGS